MDVTATVGGRRGETMKHLQRDLEGLKREILAIGAMAEDATARALEALLNRDLDLAEQVIRGDNLLDQKELEVEEECLKVLALHQPMATDLRFIVTVLKVNNDLERIGDLAANIAKRAIVLTRRRGPEPPGELRDMMEKVRRMVGRSLDSLVKLDAEIARDVLMADEAVDSLHKRMYKSLQERMTRDPDRIPDYIQLLSISRHLERMADQATNIAEDVIFTVEGELVRHGGWEQRMDEDEEDEGGGRDDDEPRLRIVPGSGD
jgi:phosphate transport system protein